MAMFQKITSVFRPLLYSVLWGISFTYFVSMALGFYLFFLTKEGQSFSGRVFYQLSLSLFLFVGPLRLPVSIPAGALFMALWLGFLLCFVLAFLIGGPKRAERGIGWWSLGKPNFLLAFPLVSSALYTAVQYIHLLQETIGIQTGSIAFRDVYSALLALSYAPFEEELNYRISVLGTIVWFEALAKLKENANQRPRPIKSYTSFFLLSWLFPDKVKQKLGMKSIGKDGILTGITPFEWVAVALTSAFFGFAHFLFGAGWQMGKVTTASVSGFVLALTYLKYGFYAPILLHWFFNFYFTAFEFAADSIAWAKVALDYLETITVHLGGLVVILAIYAMFRSVMKGLRRASVKPLSPLKS